MTELRDVLVIGIALVAALAVPACPESATDPLGSGTCGNHARGAQSEIPVKPFGSVVVVHLFEHSRFASFAIIRDLLVLILCLRRCSLHSQSQMARIE